MNEAPAAPLEHPLAQAPRVAAVCEWLARPDVRADIRFFLFVYVAGFILFTSWLA